jgi:hypothetical protein
MFGRRISIVVPPLEEIGNVVPFWGGILTLVVEADNDGCLLEL